MASGGTICAASDLIVGEIWPSCDPTLQVGDQAGGLAALAVRPLVQRDEPVEELLAFLSPGRRIGRQQGDELVDRLGQRRRVGGRIVVVVGRSVDVVVT